MRRLLRFNLRFLLLGTTLLAVWLGHHVRVARLQEAAVREITAHRGWVAYDYQLTDGDFDHLATSWAPGWLLESLGVDFFHSVEEVSFASRYDKDGCIYIVRTPDEIPWPAICRGAPRIKCLRLWGPPVTDQTLEELSGFTALESLVLNDATNVGNAGVGHLKPLRQLKWLVLTDSRVTDDALSILGTLPRLEVLNLDENDLSDEGLVQLSGHPVVRSLFVGGKERRTNEITDKGLDAIARLPNLTVLDVPNTRVTDGGVDAFIAKRPNCRVQR